MAQSYNKIQEIIPLGSNIELMVLSHSDSDHLGAVDEICAAYNVRRVLRAGHQRTSGTWNNANNAIELEQNNHNCVSSFIVSLCESSTSSYNRHSFCKTSIDTLCASMATSARGHRCEAVVTSYLSVAPALSLQFRVYSFLPDSTI